MLNPEFAANPDPRCACLLLLDTSGSMNGAPIDALNEGLSSFETDLQEDGLAKRRVEIAIVSFGGSVQIVQHWISASSFSAPTLSCQGATPMGQAIAQALQMVQARKAEYKAAGIAYYQPWIFMITDGAPTDEWQSAASLVQREVADRAISFFAVGVSGADIKTLKTITDRVVELSGLNFRELFVWLSASQRIKSASKPGEQNALPPVTFGSPA